MSVDPRYLEVVEAMPAALRVLLDAELTAGNAIVEVGHSFPAPPVGGYVKLARPISTRPRASGDGLEYYDRNGSDYSGEITDAKRFFFLLEPPHPPAPEPDMDAIRARLRASQDGGPAVHGETRPVRNPHEVAKAALEAMQSAASDGVPGGRDAGSLVARFRESMELTYERWREGTGYDLALLRAATPEERTAIERLLVARGVDDWRDVEALAALDTRQARALLRRTVDTGRAELAEAVTRYASHLLHEGERTRMLVAALETCDFYGGLTEALLHVQSHHPRAVIDALWRGVMQRSGQHAYHFAAMLLYLHGKASSPYDWEQRPFLLRFVTEDRAGREAVFRELCAKLGVKPGRYLDPA